MVLAFCEPDDEVLAHEHAFLSYSSPPQVAGRRFVAAPASATLALRRRRAGRRDDAAHQARRPRHAQQPHRRGDHRAPPPTEVLAALPARALLVSTRRTPSTPTPGPRSITCDGLDLLGDPRVIVLRTFSKIYGLAGLRVGYGVGDPGVIELLGRVGRTFNVGSLAQVARASPRSTTTSTCAARPPTRGAASSGCAPSCAAPGSSCTRRCGNFVLVETGRPTAPLYDRLLQHGRDRAADGGVGPARPACASRSDRRADAARDRGDERGARLKLAP